MGDNWKFVPFNEAVVVNPSIVGIMIGLRHNV